MYGLLRKKVIIVRKRILKESNNKIDGPPGTGVFMAKPNNLAWRLVRKGGSRRRRIYAYKDRSGAD